MPSSAEDSYDGLTVNSWTLLGSPAWCAYVDWLAISAPVYEEDPIEVPTIPACGYYVQYEWNGDKSVYFQIDSM